jgi:hypothetical protein
VFYSEDCQVRPTATVDATDDPSAVFYLRLGPLGYLIKVLGLPATG